MNDRAYDKKVTRNGKVFSIEDAVAVINAPSSSDIIGQIIMSLVENGFPITKERVFCQAIVTIIIREENRDYYQDELVKMQHSAQSYFRSFGEGLLNYDRNYYEQVASFIEAPILADNNGVSCHISATKSYSSAIEELKEDSRPYNRYAANGCINAMRRVFQPGPTNLVWTYMPMFSDPAEQEWLNSGSLDELKGVIDYFFDNYTFIKKAKYREMIMREIKLLCDSNQKSRDFFLEYYESRTELFDELFIEYPEYVFIVRGRYKRYEVLMDLAEKLEISMQDKPEVELFFSGKGESAQNNNESDNKKPFVKSKYAFDMKEHQRRLIRAFDSFTQRLLRDGEDYQIYNFWPNETLEKRSAKPIGPYIAVAFKRSDKWYLLIDGIYERCAIYIWTGEKLLDGLSIFKTNKAYARKQPNVCHMNHRGTIEDYEITYRKVLSKITTSL